MTHTCLLEFIICLNSNSAETAKVLHTHVNTHFDFSEIELKLKKKTIINTKYILNQ